MNFDALISRDKESVARVINVFSPLQGTFT